MVAEKVIFQKQSKRSNNLVSNEGVPDENNFKWGGYH